MATTFLALASALIVASGRQQGPGRDTSAPGRSETAPAQSAPTETRRPEHAAAASRLIDPAFVAPPQLESSELHREPARAPLGELSAPLPPKRRMPGGLLFRPVAVESAVIEVMGRKIAIAGTVSVRSDETCTFGGASWGCGTRARTAFRMWLRARALDCDLPPDAGDDVTASCRMGDEDVGAWLVSNGWARATQDGRYAAAEAAAKVARRGIFGPPPQVATDAATPPADLPAPSE